MSILTRTVFSQGDYLISAEAFDVKVASLAVAKINTHRILTDVDLGTGVTFGPVGNAPNGSAATVAGSVVTLEPADGLNPGLVSTTAQSFAGNKTFLGNTSFSGTTSFTGAASFSSTVNASNLGNGTTINTAPSLNAGANITAQTLRGVVQAPGATIPVRFSIFGEAFAVSLPAFSVTFAGGPPNGINFTVPAPVGFRPMSGSNMFQTVFLTSGGTFTLCFLQMSNSGVFSLAIPGANFASPVSLPQDSTFILTSGTY